MLAHKPRKWDPLILIGLGKLAKAAALVYLACALFRVMHGDLEMNLARTLEHLRVDPESRFAHHLIYKLTGIPHAKLRFFGFGTFLYAGLYGTEGVGLLRKKHWAEWLTTVGTALFVPLEAYELFRHFTWLKVAVMAVNFAIVWYLACRLLQQKRERDARPIESTPAAPAVSPAQPVQAG